MLINVGSKTHSELLVRYIKMVDRKRNVIPIIAVLIGASGLGMGVYSIMNQNQQNSLNNNLLAVWEEIYGGGSNFYIEFSDNQINTTEFFSMSDGNTSITLTQSGWYKFSFNIIFIGLITPETYQLVAEKNGGTYEALQYVVDPPAAYCSVIAKCYVLSDGDDVFKFRCFSSFDSFGVDGNQNYNQVSLEFIEEL